MTAADITREDVVRHRIGECPACHGYVWAEVTLVGRMRSSSLSDEGRATAHAHATAMAVSVHHDCDKRGDDQ